jgi:hypothetical protein
VTYALTFAAGLLLGMTWGRWTLERSLIGFPDDRGVCGAHKIGDGFWYVVPERLWVRCSLAILRGELAAGGED